MNLLTISNATMWSNSYQLRSTNALISNSSFREAAFLAKSQEITLQDSWR